MKIRRIAPIDKDGLLNVIIETPSGSQNKFDYDAELRIFKLKKTLPMGTVFPFDFGFIPNTLGADGDPLDVLVIMEPPAYVGCLVSCRILGTLEAKQKEKGKAAIRNDRIVAVADNSLMYKSVKQISDLNKGMKEEIEHFFIDYNKHEGKKFSPIKWADVKATKMLIEKGMKAAAS